jgi:hypothetical protein
VFGIGVAVRFLDIRGRKCASAKRAAAFLAVGKPPRQVVQAFVLEHAHAVRVALDDTCAPGGQQVVYQAGV